MISIIKTGYTEYLPASLAKPAQPYIPPTPAWTEYRRVESCATEPPTATWVTKIELVVTSFFDEETGTWSYTGIYKSVPSQSTVPGKRTCSFSTVQIYHPASPGQPYLPAVDAQPPRVEQNRRLGWNSGAVSVGSISGAGGYTFQVPVDTLGAVVGFTSGASTTHPGQIQHGLYLSLGSARAIESGVQVGTAGTYASGDVLAVQRRLDGTVVYLVDGVELHTSATTSYGVVSLGAVLYAAGDSVSGSEYILAAEGSSSASMPAVAGLASDHATSSSAGSMRPLQQGGGSFSFARIGSLNGTSSNRPYAESSGAFSAMGGAAYGPTVAPTTCMVEHFLFPMQGFSTGVEIAPSQSSGVMMPMIGLASNRPYGEVIGDVAPVVGFSSGRNMFNVGDAALTCPTMFASGTGSARSRNGASLSGGKATSSGFFGGGASVSSGYGFAYGSASSTGVGQAALSSPRLTVSGFGRVSFVGGSSISAKPGVVSGSFGGRARSSAKPGSVSASGIVGASGRASVGALPPFVSAIGHEQNWGYAVLTAPVGRMVHGASASMSMPRAFASGSFLSGATTGSAYAVSLEAVGQVLPVTRYTAYPFVGIARFNGRNYGVSSAGLFDLEAETDNGAAIAWSFTMSDGDMGKQVKKNIASAFFSGVMGENAMQFSISSNLDATYSYTPPPSRVGESKNHRVKFGRGNSDRFAIIGVSGTSRSEFHTIGLEVLDSKRST